jgi:hypothetical protein
MAAEIDVLVDAQGPTAVIHHGGGLVVEYLAIREVAISEITNTVIGRGVEQSGLDGDGSPPIRILIEAHRTSWALGHGVGGWGREYTSDQQGCD